MGDKRSSKQQGYSDPSSKCEAPVSCSPSEGETELVRYLQQHTHISLLLIKPTLADIASSCEDVAALALRSLGYALHHEDIVTAFTDECARAVLDTLLKVVTTTVQKGLCRLGVWCLGVQEFGAPLLESRIHLIVKAILHAIDNPMASKAVTYEALQVVVKMVNRVPKMRLESPLWAPPVYRKLLSLDKRDRDMAEQCFKDVESSLLPPLASLSKVVAVDISQKLLCVMEKLVRSKAFVIPTIRAWRWLVHLLGSKVAGENRVLVNQMLKVAEVTFTSTDSQVQIASLVAWEALIDALIQQDDNLQQQMDEVSPSTRSTHKPYASPSVKRLKLLMTPLLTIMSGASLQSVRVACWCTWTYLGHKLDLGINNSSVQAVVVNPMFEAVFKAGPERGSCGVWDLCLNALEAWITCKIQDKLDSRSTWAFSTGIEGGVSSPKTPSQTKSTESEVKVLPINWASWSMESLKLILMLIKALWIRGVKDMKQSSDNLSLNGAIRMLILIVRGIDGEGKGAVRPSAENVASVHAVLKLVEELSGDCVLTEVEVPLSTLWPAFKVLLEFGYLVLSSSFYKLPFCPLRSHLKNGNFSGHLKPLNTSSLAEVVPSLETLVTPIAYIIGMWIQVGCSLSCKNKEEAKVLQKLEKLSECTKTGLGIMSNLQGVGIGLNWLLSQNSKLLAADVEAKVGTNLTGVHLSSKDFYFLQIWKIFACELANYIESANDIPAVESGIQDSGYQVVHTFLLLPVQLCFNVVNIAIDSNDVSQRHTSHRHINCPKLLLSSNELDFVAAAWARLYDCCSRVSSLRSSQPNLFGSAYCQKISRFLETHECSRDQGGIDKLDCCENLLLLDILGFVVKHVLRQIEISSLAMLAINRKKRLGSFVGGSYHGKLLSRNDVDDSSNVRDSLCLASRLLDLSWSRLTTGKTCWLGVALRVLSALAGFITRIYSQQDCLILLQDFSRPLAKWLSFSDSACPLSEALQQALQDLWEKLLTLIRKCQPPLCYDSSLLSLQSPLLVPSFQHSRTQISNSALTFWESTYGCKASFLKYPPCLVPVLQQLRAKVNITLPGWEKTMALKDSAEIVSEKPPGARKHLRLLQDETLINKSSKQAKMSCRSEVEGMYMSSKLRSSNLCQNAKGKSIEKPLDALLEKIKRPACKSPAFEVSGNSGNTVSKSIDALVCTSTEQSNDISNKDAVVLHEVESANQYTKIKQRDEGSTHEASKAIHYNREPLEKRAFNAPSPLKSSKVTVLPCEGPLKKAREYPSSPSQNGLASDCATSLQMNKCNNLRTSDWDSGGAARRKKLRFLDDEHVEFATIPLSQKKAGPLTDHQKEVRLAQSGALGKGCTSHGAGIRTYTSMDFSQSQIVFDSEDPEDICLEIPVRVIEDGEEFQCLDSSLISTRAETKHSSPSIILRNGQTNMLHEDDKLLKLPNELIIEDGKNAEHQLIHRENLQSEGDHSQPQFSACQSGTELIKCLHVANGDECKEVNNKECPVSSFCEDQVASAVATLLESHEVGDVRTDPSLMGSGSSQEKRNKELSSSLQEKQQGLIMYKQKHGLPNAECSEVPQYVPSAELRGSKEKCEAELWFEQDQQSAPNKYFANFKQAVDDGNNLAPRAQESSSLLYLPEQEALDGQTQLVTQPCDTQLLMDSGETQLLQESDEEELGRLAPANGAVCALLSAASSSCQWNNMDMHSLECAQRLLNSIQRHVDEAKMRIVARNLHLS